MCSARRRRAKKSTDRSARVSKRSQTPHGLQTSRRRYLTPTSRLLLLVHLEIGLQRALHLLHPLVLHLLHPLVLHLLHPLVLHLLHPLVLHLPHPLVLHLLDLIALTPLKRS